MKCPFDDTDLKVVERNNIEIDWCETCKGVWLERGELDKIIEAVEIEHTQRFENSRNQKPRERIEFDDDRYDRRPQPRYNERDYRHQSDYKRKKKSSFLSEMFEF